MNPDRISVKFFLKEPADIDLDKVVPVFQRWIQDHTVEDMLIDVVDYKHVHEGPGIVLIAHEGDYGFDLGDGRPGLLYVRKRDGGDTLKKQLNLIFRHVLSACQQLEAETTLDGITFDYNNAKINFADRLNAPNTPETFESVSEDVQTFLSSIYGNDVSLENANQDKRETFAIHANVVGNVDIEKVLERLNSDQTVAV